MTFGSRGLHMFDLDVNVCIYAHTYHVCTRYVLIPSHPASRASPRRQEVISPLHDTSQPEAAPPQAHPLGPQGGDEHERQQARAGGEQRDRGRRRVAADELAVAVRGGGRGGEVRDRVGGGDLERGGAVVELVVQHLGVGAGDLEVA